jgi:hypothetical protein
MSEDEARRMQEDEVDEVEAHRRAAANEETAEETAGDDDVEGHMRKGAPSEEGGRAL